MLLTTHGETPYTGFSFRPDDTLLLGRTTSSIHLVQAPGTVFNLAQCEEQRGQVGPSKRAAVSGRMLTSCKSHNAALTRRSRARSTQPVGLA